MSSLVADYLESYFIFDPEFGDETYMLGDIANILREKDIRLHGSERAQFIELARVLASKGARKVHTRNGNRWTGFYARIVNTL